MQKTTVYLEETAYRQLKQIARQRRRSPAALVREAVAEYARRHSRSARPRSLGAYRSGLTDLGSRADHYLAGFGQSK